MAKAAEDRACTKAASRVPESDIYLTLKTYESRLINIFLMRGALPHEPTLVHDSAKYIDSTWRGRTVPAAIPELVLALSQWDENTRQDYISWHAYNVYKW